VALFRGVVAPCCVSTVQVKGDGKELCLGTVVDADGFILTKVSELKGKLVVRTHDGKELEAKVVGAHQPTDLALLKVDAKGLKAVEWADSKVAPLGSWVASPGLGQDPVAIGVVSVLSRKLPASRPSPARSADGGYLGVSLDPDEAGAKVAEVLAGTPAQKAGVKINDLILSVDKKEVNSSDALIQLLQKYKPGDTVTLKVKRDDQEMELKATLAKRPANRADFQNRLGSELSERRTGFPIILQHDSVLRARDCGGPLVDLEGRVIGINVSRAGRTESYAIPAEAVRPLLADLKAGKHPPPAELVEPTAEQKLNQAKTAVQKAEADKAAFDRKLTETQAALKKAEADQPEIEKRLAELKAALQKLEAEKAGIDKKLADAQDALRKLEAESKK
jgi:serine protease Do